MDLDSKAEDPMKKTLKLGDYPTPTCDCKNCVAMCQRFPCRLIPRDWDDMPDDVRKRLTLNQLYGGSEVGTVEVLQAGSRGYEGEEFPDSARGFFGFGRQPMQCTFLTAEGKCELHGRCKPWEGRAAICDKGRYPEGHENTVYDLGFSDRLSELLLDEWNTPYGRQVIREWRELTGWYER